MKHRFSYYIVSTILTTLALPVHLAAQDKQLTQTDHKHHHYKLIVLGTLGGPQSYGDAGLGAANINQHGTAAGVADTADPDPFYPNFNPLPSNIGSYPFVYHAFTTNGGALTDLGGLPGGGDSVASYITENGLVSGDALDGTIDPYSGWPAEHAVLWKYGHIIDLGTLGGYESQAGTANSRGQVTGFATNAVPDPLSVIYWAFYRLSNGTQTRAFVWDEKGGMQDLGTLGGPDAVAVAINERGQIAGDSYTTSIANPTTGIPTQDPFLWENGKMMDLGTLGGTGGFSIALNNRGEVIGQSNLAGDTVTHGFIWSNGKLIDVGTLGGTFGSPNALNDAGDVAGQATTASGELHAFFWKRGLITDLGPVPGFGDSTCIGAFGINSQDQVVGQAVQNYCAGPAAHAFLWENGDMLDLNQFVPEGLNITLTDVEKINDRGEMFGIGTLTTGEDRAFLLIPCDENHPGVEGCDYRMIEANLHVSGTPVPMTHSTTNSDDRNSMLSTIDRRLRFRVPGPQARPRTLAKHPNN